MQYLRNELCCNPGCHDVEILRGYCGKHWNERTRRHMEKVRQALIRAMPAIRLCLQLIANPRLKLVL